MCQKGSRRHVFIIGQAAFKVPRIWILLSHIVFQIREAFNCSQRRVVFEDEYTREVEWETVGGFSRLFRFLQLSLQWSWQEFLDSGFGENYREAKYYLCTRHHLLSRLYLPLILVNVYKREDGVGQFSFDDEELFWRIKDSGDKEFLAALENCAHTLDFSNNFAYDNGRVKILDYGQQGIEELIVGQGDKIEKLLLEYAIP